MAITVFLCYAQKEGQMAEELKKQLVLLERNGTITIRDYGNINPGAEWEQEFEKYVDEAQMILLLISADFLASNYLYKEIMQRAITRHEYKGTRVIPIIMRSVHWQEPPLDKLQPLPDYERSIATWRPREEGFKKVVDGILKVTKQWETHSLPEPVMERKAFIEKLDQLVTAVKTQLQPPPRANATANTLQQLSIFTPNETSLADLVVGWQILSHPSQQEEDPATAQRRVTCGELAMLAAQLTTEQGNLAQAIKTWHAWEHAFKNSDDPRQAAMTKTFARELAELQGAM